MRKGPKPRPATIHPECSSPGCKNKKRIAHRNKTTGKIYYGNECYTCNHRKWRDNHPAEAAFYNLKHRAQERGHAFKITRRQFVEWCEKTGYHNLKGKTAGSMSVDRKDETGPYEIGNIQMITLSENSKKMHEARAAALGIDPSKPYTDEDRPF